MYAHGRDELTSGLALQLAKTFVIAKEEELVFLDLSSQRASELIPVKCGNVRRRIIEVILRVENAVAQKFKHRAMQGVRARSADRVDYGAGSSEFSAVGVGQDAELLNRLDSERVACDGRSRPVVEETLQFRVVEQERLADGPRTGDRIVGSLPVESGGSASTRRALWDGLHTRRQRQQRRKIPAIQRQ